jgi:PhnB protein
MAANSIREGFHTVTPYIIVDGAEKLIKFLTNAFGAKELFRIPGKKSSVSHAEIEIGSSRIMLGDSGLHIAATAGLYCIFTDDVDAVYKKALAAGAVPVSEPKDEYYGDRTAAVEDFAGNQWWLLTHIEDVTPDEMKRRKEEWKKTKGSE